MKTKVIVNPKAGQGKAQKLWPMLSKQCDFLKPYDEQFTKAAGETTPITLQAIKAGYERIVIIGGDGSLTEAVNGFFENEKLINSNAILGTIPLGTGSDFLKSFNIFDVDQAISSLKKNKTSLCDVGRVTYLGRDQKPRTQFFLNIASFGCAGKIVDRVNQSRKPLGATLTYLGITLQTFLTYPSPEVELLLDGKTKKKVAINNCFVCNGKFSGSGMMWGPKASPTDGLLDLTVVKEIPKLQGLLHMQKVYQGRALEVPGVERFQCHTLKATSKDSVLLEVDGDTVGMLPAEFSLSPYRIRMWV